MVKDIKYIIKRIIIGVGIALVLLYLKGNLALQVKANSISPYQWGGYSYTITSNTTNFNFTVPSLPGGGQPWFNHYNGILRFNLSINKLTGDNTQAFPIPRTIVATSGNNRFVCSFGNTQWQNSTFVGVTYSVECPMNLYDNNGVDSVLIAFNPTGMPVNNTYNMTISSDASFEIYEGTSVNVTTDTSSTTNAINNQISNDNQNTTNIINNQNDNTQDIIDSNKVCTKYDSISISTDNYYLSSNGVSQSNSSWGITDYISISDNSDIYLLGESSGYGPSTCFYNVNKSIISCVTNGSLSNNSTLTIPSNSSFVRFSINKQNNRPQFQVCRNGNQAIADTQQEINNSLNDNTGVDSSSWRDMVESLDIQSMTPVSDLLTMPLTLLQAFISGFSNTCREIHLGTLYSSNLIIPCVNLENVFGTSLWNTIDLLFSVFLIYRFAMFVISTFDNITSLKDDFTWLYGVEGSHIAAPSRVERNSDLY